MALMFLALLSTTLFCSVTSGANKHELRKKFVASHRIFYPPGMTEETLPTCDKRAICNKVDLYGEPYVTRGCRCTGAKECSRSLNQSDGHSIKDKSRLFKTCDPVRLLPTCRYFKDITRTFYSYPNNKTVELMSCMCPKESVAYIIKRHSFFTDEGVGYKYAFACAPHVKLRCRRKEPCRLFTVKKKKRHEEVNMSTICSCPPALRCPSHHIEPGIIPGKIYKEDSMRTYSGYCM